MEYTHQLLSSEESHRVSGKRLVKAGVAFSVGLLGGLALLALSAPTVQDASVAEAGDLMALPLASSTAQSRVTPQAVMSTLQKYGMQPSPFAKLAITEIAATRGVCTQAQVQEEMSNLDAASQAKLNQVNSKVVVRTMAIEKEKMAGIIPPIGEFWDPLGLSAKFGDGNQLYFLRQIELKHGRFGMMASLGILVGEKFHPFFGDANFESAIQVHIEPVLVEKFWPAAVTLIGLHELFFLPQKEGGLPGDLGFDPLGLKPKDEKEFLEIQNKELANGRLAMLAAAGMIAEELFYGKLSV